MIDLINGFYLIIRYSFVFFSIISWYYECDFSNITILFIAASQIKRFLIIAVLELVRSIKLL